MVFESPLTAVSALVGFLGVLVGLVIGRFARIFDQTEYMRGYRDRGRSSEDQAMNTLNETMKTMISRKQDTSGKDHKEIQ